jgi:Secretion system C-terminal sorting domain
VVDMLGREIVNQYVHFKANRTSVKLLNIQSGTYLVVVKDSNGNQLYLDKIIVLP